MVWPTGFFKIHKKETIEYKSDSCLHNGKYPYLSVKLQGGVIIDLKTTGVEEQVASLLQVDERDPDSELCEFLQQKADFIRGS